jgi:DNA-binding HxlR family transcriptional regulator
VRRASFADMPCSVAQALEVVGERWTLLVVRDCLLGVTRFDQIQQRLGIARNVLSDRLELLVEAEVLERRPYQERPVRYEYVLTERGRDLWPVVQSLQAWGDRWAGWDAGPPVEQVHQPCGQPSTSVPTCSACRGVLHPEDLRPQAGGHPANVLP